jgi:septal ring factor EnvC (AmiA/AmiB activator)
VGDLYNKTNAPYLIAGTLATLTLLASGVFAIAPYVAFLSPIAAFNVALPVALSMSIFSVLVLVLSYKIIKNNKEIEIEKNKFAKQNIELGNTKQQLEAILKELNNRDSQIRELKDKIIEVVDAASKQTEKLNDQLYKLTRKRLDADKEMEKYSL